MGKLLITFDNWYDYTNALDVLRAYNVSYCDDTTRGIVIDAGDDADGITDDVTARMEENDIYGFNFVKE